MGNGTTVLVLGASGMLGNAVLRFFAHSPGYSVTGAVRSAAAAGRLPAELRDRIATGIDVQEPDSLLRLFAETQPRVVINCVGVVKQLAEADDPLTAIPINSLLPHRLARLCHLSGARLVHVSTDCVFAGTKGMYREDDPADAADLYGRSKLLGEVDAAHAVTLRTSIIGHELASAHGLIGWFLGQRTRVQGYTRAVFSGVPTVELARIIRDFVIPDAGLRGLYHVSAQPISKHDLLHLVARIYEIPIAIQPDDHVAIDRSLDSSRFRARTGYAPPSWPELIRAMRDFN